VTTDLITNFTPLSLKPTLLYTVSFATFFYIFYVSGKLFFCVCYKAYKSILLTTPPILSENDNYFRDNVYANRVSCAELRELPVTILSVTETIQSFLNFYGEITEQTKV
jgi:hypothetical protein